MKVSIDFGNQKVIIDFHEHETLKNYSMTYWSKDLLLFKIKNIINTSIEDIEFFFNNIKLDKNIPLLSQINGDSFIVAYKVVTYSMQIEKSLIRVPYYAGIPISHLIQFIGTFCKWNIPQHCKLFLKNR